MPVRPVRVCADEKTSSVHGVLLVAEERSAVEMRCLVGVRGAAVMCWGQRLQPRNAGDEWTYTFLN